MVDVAFLSLATLKPPPELIDEHVPAAAEGRTDARTRSQRNRTIHLAFPDRAPRVTRPADDLATARTCAATLAGERPLPAQPGTQPTANMPGFWRSGRPPRARPDPIAMCGRLIR